MIPRLANVSPETTPITEENTKMPVPARFSRRLALVLSAAALTIAALAPAAGADFGPTEFDGVITADAAGAPQTQAGAHPFDYTTTIKFNTKPDLLQPSKLVPDEQLKDTVVSLPPGLVGNVNALPTCSESDLATQEFSAGNCPANTQIGYVTLKTAGPFSTLIMGVYNQKPSPGSAATFGFNSPLGAGTIHLQAHLRTGSDYGVDIEAPDNPQQMPILSVELVIWGVPAAASHDQYRAKGYLLFAPESEPDVITPVRPGGTLSSAPEAPFLTMPTSCSGPTTTTLRTDSWLHPGVFKEASFLSHDKDGNTVYPSGCDNLPFTPAFSLKPASRVAGEPTGYRAELSMPYLDNPSGLSQAALKKVSVKLPQGVSVSPSSVNGLGSCTPAQVDLKGPGAANCPADSKIGEVQIDSPLVEHPLPGAVYLASQGTNPFNSLLALYLTIEDPQTGIAIKLPGRVAPDSSTGQLTVTFDDNPQLPFETLHMELKGGARAPLVNPIACGTYTTHAEFGSWASAEEVVSSDSSFTIDQGCGKGGEFNPGLEAGTTNPVGGAHSPFGLRVTREDGQQNISAIEAKLPEGLLAKLKGVALCGDADAASGNCPAASQVGSVTVGVGAGTNPIYVPQPGKAPTAVYLAGPYKGAPYSLVVKVPAQAGPFDLGTVTVRNALNVDPSTAQVTAKSDPLPQILQGVPISYRDVRVDVDRPDFTLNPTSCDPMEVTSTITSVQGKTANPSSRFQVANCERLDFKPSLNLKVSGATKRGAYPKLRAELKAKPGEANIGKVSVALPHSEFLAQEHIKTICTRVQYAADQCPAGSIYGKATAWSPLLDKPLSGPVYLRSSSNPLPDLVVALKGQIDIDLAGRIDSVNGGIRNTFSVVPDAPVSKFVLEMQGGKKSLLVNSRNLCAKGAGKATVKMDGQNGKAHDFSPVLGTSCGKGGKKGK